MMIKLRSTIRIKAIAHPAIDPLSFISNCFPKVNTITLSALFSSMYTTSSSSNIHPEDRLKAARQRALDKLKQELIMQQDEVIHPHNDGNSSMINGKQNQKDDRNQISATNQKQQNSSKIHSEDRLEAARKQSLDKLGLESIQAKAHQLQQTSKSTIVKKVPICQANNHPSYRLQEARKEALAKLGVFSTAIVKEVKSKDAKKKQDASRTGEIYRDNNAAALKNENFLSQSMDERLRNGRLRASQRIQHFPPVATEKGKPNNKSSVIMPHYLEEKPRENDSISSGSIVQKRLRQKRIEAIKKLLNDEKQ